MRYSTPAGYFSIESMPNQPSVALCFDFTVIPEYRGTKAAHRLKAYQMDLLREQHFSLAICTTKKENEAQNKVLRSAGWDYISEFQDLRTNSPTLLWHWKVE